MFVLASQLLEVVYLETLETMHRSFTEAELMEPEDHYFPVERCCASIVVSYIYCIFQALTMVYVAVS